MRTTLDIDDDLIEALRPLAVSQRRSLGRLISDLVRASMRAEATVASENGFPVFEVSHRAPLFGSSDVARALDE